MKGSPLHGEVWRADLDRVRGHQQGRVRPVLIVSSDLINSSAANMVTVVPITTKARQIRSFLKISPPEGGLSQTSYIICDQLRTISKERLGKRFGALSRNVLQEVERRLAFMLDLR